ncbi:FAD-binding oxidoreductase [Streptomyces sp. NPDC002889]|uniref:FAD-binding oxidoreductase n=1 Tax=Streptomyces sp. NPDC002889 TaxID=3364669 RepID=UPI0036B107A3
MSHTGTDINSGRWSRRRLLTTGAVSVGAAALPAAAAADPGPLTDTTPGAVSVVPGDPRYRDLVTGMNQRWTGRPEEVRLARSTAHVVAAVQEAVTAGKRLTVRSGGHCYEDFVFNSETQVVLDMSGMNAVDYDPERRAFRVEAGATLLDVYERLYKGWGVTVPGGMCYSVGAGGHISGGGWGLLCRRDGISVDHLYAVEVVVVDAEGTVRTVVATREQSDPNRELWWAHTGGGGGNFGVVTRYWFRSPRSSGADPAQALPKPPGEVLLSAIQWSWSRMTQSAFTTLVGNYGAWHEAHRAPGGPYAGLCSFLRLSHRSNGTIGLVTQMDATVPDAERRLDEFIAAITQGVDVPHGPLTTGAGEHGPMPEFFIPQRWPWLRATRYLGTTNRPLVDPSLRSDYKSAYMRTNFPDSQISAFYRHLNREDFSNGSAMVVLSSYGGEVNAVAPEATATPHRDSAFKLLYQTYWSEPDDDAANLDWIRSFYEDVYGDTGGVPVANGVTGGCYVNYADIDLGDAQRNTSGVPWYTLYYGANYPRLQQAKAKWDPRDFFRHGQSIRLPGHA